MACHIVFISILGLINRSLQIHICADFLRRLILQCSSLLIILTLCHKGRWFPFYFHIWFSIHDFSISPLATAFRYFSNLIFCGRHVSLLYTQLQGIEYTQFLIILNSVGGLTPKRYLGRVEPLVNIVLMSYGLHIL